MKESALAVSGMAGEGNAFVVREVWESSCRTDVDGLLDRREMERRLLTGTGIQVHAATARGLRTKVTLGNV